MSARIETKDFETLVNQYEVHPLNEPMVHTMIAGYLNPVNRLNYALASNKLREIYEYNLDDFEKGVKENYDLRYCGNPNELSEVFEQISTSDCPNRLAMQRIFLHEYSNEISGGLILKYAPSLGKKLLVFALIILPILLMVTIIGSLSLGLGFVPILVGIFHFSLINTIIGVAVFVFLVHLWLFLTEKSIRVPFCRNSWFYEILY